LTNLKRLKWLSLFYLDVHDLAPLAGLATLTNLNVSWNFWVTNISALNGLTNVVELYATAEGLTDISFAPHMPRLNRLEIGYNNVTNLSPLLGHAMLALWAYSDTLADAQLVTNFTDLQILHMESTGLTDRGLARLTHLQELYLDNNPALASFSFLSPLTNLVYLGLGQLGLTSVPSLAHLSLLTDLHLQGNTNLTDFSSLLGLSNLRHLDVNQCPAANFAMLGGVTNLTWLEMNGNGLDSVSFLASLVNLNRLDIQNNQFTTLASLAGSSVNELYVQNNWLGDITALLTMPHLTWQVDLYHNLLDLSPASAAWNVITNLQSRYVRVNYLPQDITTTLTILQPPQDLCIASGTDAYFEVLAISSAAPITYQWFLGDQLLPDQTNAFLLLTSVSTNQAGFYHVLLHDGNGGASPARARLYVGDPHCGQTVYFTQQPVNACAAPGEDVTFSATVVTTLTNLYYQWLFNGTNLDGQTESDLFLGSVDDTYAGSYQVLAWDDSSNVVASATVQLVVVSQVTFNDLTLSNLVVAQLVSQGPPPGSPMPLTDLDNLTYLDLSSSVVTNLDSLRCARFLTELHLSHGSSITDFRPLAWVQTLQTLYLDGCGLFDASFLAGLFNLGQLDLDDNQILSLLPLAGLTNLTWLSLNHNGCLLDTAALAGLTSLQTLNLHSDCLHDLSFVAGMNQLTVLDAGADGSWDSYLNQIQDISPLADKTLLYWLSLSWNQVTNVPLVGHLPLLQYLYLTSNRFDRLDFVTNLPNLVDLSINYSQVTNLAPLAGSSHLSGSLDVGYIATTNLWPVAGLTNLQYFYGGGNHAGSLAPAANLHSLRSLGYEGNDAPDLSPLAGMPWLNWANLEANHFTSAAALPGHTNLSYLYLSWNQIHDLTPLAGLTNLSSLSLAGNGFTNLAPVAGLWQLNWLTANSNHIQDASPVAGLTNLHWTLDLSQNEISDLSPVTNLHALTWLGIWGNRLTTLPWLGGLTSLNWLDLHDNLLTDITGLAGMPQLQNVNLDNNRLTSIPPLPNLLNLQNFSANSNLLADLSGLATLTNLHWLYLEANRITSLQSLTSFPTLWWLGVRWNRLDTTPGSLAMQQVTELQNHGTGVIYIPQTPPGSDDQITSPEWLGAGGFRFTIVSPAPRAFAVQRSSDLANHRSLLRRGAALLPAPSALRPGAASSCRVALLPRVFESSADFRS
ncbi:MAG: leucine-rich repeat domain-containing protein, partial [Verrucomicrobia bacterium]|nr:leucine-rich repeat domain-containing protein [Verrucomicrobiota bacterium]